MTHARDLLNEPDEIKVIELPGLREKGDIVDWAKMPGNDKERLMAIVGNTAEWFEETTGPDIHHSKAKNFFYDRHGQRQTPCDTTWQEY